MDSAQHDPQNERTPPPGVSSEEAVGGGAAESGEEPSRAPVAEMAIELAVLARRWCGLTLQQAIYDLRANISEVLTLTGLMLLGGLILLGGFVFLDILLFLWLRDALASAKWALALLVCGHVAVGGVLIRAALTRLKGEDEP